MRLFFALRFSDPSPILSIQKRLQAQCRSGNFTRPENLHMTLAFLGETDRVSKLREISGICAQAVPPCLICFDRIGQIAGQKGEKLYYLSGEAPPNLQNLASMLQEDLRNAGFSLEKRKFLPHVTMARRCRPLSGIDPAKLQFLPISVQFENLTLLCSERIDGRLVYTPIGENALRGGQTERSMVCPSY